MKKGFCLFLTAALLACCFIVPAAAVVRGDVNADGSVGADDARLALRRSVDLETFEPGSDAFTAADFDGDGTVSAMDARSILRVSVNLPVTEGLRRPTENNQYDALRSGTYYVKGRMLNATEITEMEMAVTDNTLYAVSDMDGINFAVLVVGKTTYLMLPDKKAYLKVTATEMRLIGMDPDEMLKAGDPGFSKMRPLSEAASVEETQYRGTPCFAYSIPGAEGTAGSSIVYLNGDTLLAIQDVSEAGYVVGTMEFDEVSGTVPADKRSVPSDYSKKTLFGFMGLLGV
ncbi:MAG: dockerin type I repeat-containing protein [Clostridia bacterium]|nr:dockerin type I repeat-containing protein [Clostridia bacterium]